MANHITIGDNYIVFNNTSSTVVIDRTSVDVANVVVTDENEKNVKRFDIFGVLGMINLLDGLYIVICNNAHKVGSLLGHSLLHVADVRIIRISNSPSTLSPIQAIDEEMFLKLLKSQLIGGYVYFSPDFDITRNLQAQEEGEQAENTQFMWNYALKSEFDKFNERLSSEFGVKAICGYMKNGNFNVNQKSFDYVFISRRSRFRVGTRFNIRGLDDDGRAANFVETEQIVINCETGDLSSVVQIRGSIPLVWKQKTKLTWKPKVVFGNSDESASSFKKHVDQIEKDYGKIVFVNLVDQKKSELELSQAFEKLVDDSRNDNLNYLAFDFHKECANMRYDRLNLLLNQVENDIDNHKFFVKDANGKVLSKQSGVIRSNCMDCLDRTNVTQSVFAKYLLVQQLRKISIFDSNDDNDNIEKFPELLTFFRNVWADNADAISVQYSGTPALKTDFTRTGARSVHGIIQDGVNSVTRYYLNNFTDGIRQDSYDLFVGNFEANRESQHSPFVKTNFKSWGIAFGLLYLYMIVTAFFPPSLDPLPFFLFLFSQIASGFAIYSVLTKFNHYFVNHPSLNNRDRQQQHH